MASTYGRAHRPSQGLLEVDVTGGGALPHQTQALRERRPVPATEKDKAIAALVAERIPDGATIQAGIGGVPNALLAMLGNHCDLGIHTELLSDGIVDWWRPGSSPEPGRCCAAGRSSPISPWATRQMGGRDIGVDDDKAHARLARREAGCSGVVVTWSPPVGVVSPPHIDEGRHSAQPVVQPGCAAVLTARARSRQLARIDNPRLDLSVLGKPCVRRRH